MSALDQCAPSSTSTEYTNTVLIKFIGKRCHNLLISAKKKFVFCQKAMCESGHVIINGEKDVLK